ncbi:unnamed protein product, partial [Nippostrongylus brasiliensis]|uniref:SEA domain-containing protein n=1 Tax=Nippostrongylus brasiliensis TaxID=27835 RepID=A0A0N4YVV2_NIPBR
MISTLYIVLNEHLAPFCHKTTEYSATTSTSSTSSPSVSTTTVTSSSLSSRPNDTIVEKDEKEVVKPIDGDSKTVSTTVPPTGRTSSAPTGKQITDEAVTVTFQPSTSEASPSPSLALTTDRGGAHHTTVTVPSSTIIGHTLEHRFSTNSPESDSDSPSTVSGITEISQTTPLITTDNQTVGGDEVKLSTTSVDTNPSETTYSTHNARFSTANPTVEVTQDTSSTVLPELATSTASADEFTFSSTDGTELTTEEEFLPSQVFQRESTTRSSPTLPSNITQPSPTSASTTPNPSVSREAFGTTGEASYESTESPKFGTSSTQKATTDGSTEVTSFSETPEFTSDKPSGGDTLPTSAVPSFESSTPSDELLQLSSTGSGSPVTFDISLSSSTEPSSGSDQPTSKEETSRETSSSSPSTTSRTSGLGSTGSKDSSEPLESTTSTLFEGTRSFDRTTLPSSSESPSLSSSIGSTRKPEGELTTESSGEPDDSSTFPAGITTAKHMKMPPITSSTDSATEEGTTGPTESPSSGFTPSVAERASTKEASTSSAPSETEGTPRSELTSTGGEIPESSREPSAVTVTEPWSSSQPPTSPIHSSVTASTGSAEVRTTGAAFGSSTVTSDDGTPKKATSTPAIPGSGETSESSTQTASSGSTGVQSTSEPLTSPSPSTTSAPTSADNSFTETVPTPSASTSGVDTTASTGKAETSKEPEDTSSSLPPTRSTETDDIESSGTETTPSMITNSWTGTLSPVDTTQSPHDLDSKETSTTGKPLPEETTTTPEETTTTSGDNISSGTVTSEVFWRSSVSPDGNVSEPTTVSGGTSSPTGPTDRIRVTDAVQEPSRSAGPTDSDEETTVGTQTTTQTVTVTGALSREVDRSEATTSRSGLDVTATTSGASRVTVDGDIVAPKVTPTVGDKIIPSSSEVTSPPQDTTSGGHGASSAPTPSEVPTTGDHSTSVPDEDTSTPSSSAGSSPGSPVDVSSPIPGNTTDEGSVESTETAATTGTPEGISITGISTSSKSTQEGLDQTTEPAASSPEATTDFKVPPVKDSSREPQGGTGSSLTSPFPSSESTWAAESTTVSEISSRGVMMPSYSISTEVTDGTTTHMTVSGGTSSEESFRTAAPTRASEDVTTGELDTKGTSPSSTEPTTGEPSSVTSTSTPKTGTDSSGEVLVTKTTIPFTAPSRESEATTDSSMVTTSEGDLGSSSSTVGSIISSPTPSGSGESESTPDSSSGATVDQRTSSSFSSTQSSIETSESTTLPSQSSTPHGRSSPRRVDGEVTQPSRSPSISISTSGSSVPPDNTEETEATTIESSGFGDFTGEHMESSTGITGVSPSSTTLPADDAGEGTPSTSAESFPTRAVTTEGTSRSVTPTRQKVDGEVTTPEPTTTKGLGSREFTESPTSSASTSSQPDEPGDSIRVTTVPSEVESTEPGSESSQLWGNLSFRDSSSSFGVTSASTAPSDSVRTGSTPEDSLGSSTPAGLTSQIPADTTEASKENTSREPSEVSEETTSPTTATSATEGSGQSAASTVGGVTASTQSSAVTSPQKAEFDGTTKKVPSLPGSSTPPGDYSSSAAPTSTDDTTEPTSTRISGPVTESPFSSSTVEPSTDSGISTTDSRQTTTSTNQASTSAPSSSLTPPSDAPLTSAKGEPTTESAATASPVASTTDQVVEQTTEVARSSVPSEAPSSTAQREPVTSESSTDVTSSSPLVTEASSFKTSTDAPTTIQGEDSSTISSTAPSSTSVPMHENPDITESPAFTSTPPLSTTEQLSTEFPRVFERENTTEGVDDRNEVTQVTRALPTNFVTVDNHPDVSSITTTPNPVEGTTTSPTLPTASPTESLPEGTDTVTEETMFTDVHITHHMEMVSSEKTVLVDGNLGQSPPTRPAVHIFTSTGTATPEDVTPRDESDHTPGDEVEETTLPTDSKGSSPTRVTRPFRTSSMSWPGSTLPSETQSTSEELLSTPEEPMSTAEGDTTVPSATVSRVSGDLKIRTTQTRVRSTSSATTSASLSPEVPSAASTPPGGLDERLTTTDEPSESKLSSTVPSSWSSPKQEGTAAPPLSPTDVPEVGPDATSAGKDDTSPTGMDGNLGGTSPAVTVPSSSSATRPGATPSTPNDQGTSTVAPTNPGDELTQRTVGPESSPSPSPSAEPLTTASNQPEDGLGTTGLPGDQTSGEAVRTTTSETDSGTTGESTLKPTSPQDENLSSSSTTKPGGEITTRTKTTDAGAGTSPPTVPGGDTTPKPEVRGSSVATPLGESSTQPSDTGKTSSTLQPEDSTGSAPPSTISVVDTTEATRPNRPEERQPSPSLPEIESATTPTPSSSQLTTDSAPKSEESTPSDGGSHRTTEPGLDVTSKPDESSLGTSSALPSLPPNRVDGSLGSNTERTSPPPTTPGGSITETPDSVFVDLPSTTSPPVPGQSSTTRPDESNIEQATSPASTQPGLGTTSSGTTGEPDSTPGQG